jgi:hypothetical protein
MRVMVERCCGLDVHQETAVASSDWRAGCSSDQGGADVPHDEGSYLKDKYHRLKARRGGLLVALAIAHKILRLAYRDLGEAISTSSTKPLQPTSSAGWNGSAIQSLKGRAVKIGDAVLGRGREIETAMR